MEQRKNDFKTKVIARSKRISAYFISALIDFKRSPLTIFFTIAYPLILILLFGAIFSNVDSSSVTFIVYYQSEGDVGYEIAPSVHLNLTDDLLYIIKNIQRNDSSSVFEMHNIPLKDELNNSINPGSYLDKVGGYIAMIIPPNFTQEVFLHPPINITLILNENSVLATIASNIITGIIYNFNLGMAGYNDTKIGLETFDIYLAEEIEYFEFLIPGIIAIAIMNNGVMGTINRYSYFDRKGLFRKITTTPIKKGDIVAGEATWVLTQGILSIIVILLVSWLVFKIPSSNFSWIYQILDWKMIPITISAVLSFTGLGMIGARMTKTPGASVAVGNFLVFPMMFLSGAFFEVSHIPIINVVSKFLPLTYIIEAFRASMITPNPPVAWINLGISMIFGVVLFTIGIVVTKLSER